ncbi:MAG TPA: hypothetical protein VGM03_20105 [Phycisphaerae bacterium]|jgi:hypothetical protein
MKTMTDVWREQGREQGREAGARRTILRFASRRFGEPRAEQRARLEVVHDLDRLDRITDAIDRAANWDELLNVA